MENHEALEGKPSKIGWKTLESNISKKMEKTNEMMENHRKTRGKAWIMGKSGKTMDDLDNEITCLVIHGDIIGTQLVTKNLLKYGVFDYGIWMYLASFV